MPSRADLAAPSLRRAAAVLACSFALLSPAYAAHPLATEDTGTQGAGRFELELGFQRAHADELRAAEFGTQLSYGVTDAFDVIVRPAWLDVRNSDVGSNVRGFGDTSVGFKWRAVESDTSSAGVRADVILPTGDARRDLGLGEASYHLVGIVTADLDAWHVHGNLAYNRLPEATGLRRDLFSVSGAAVWSASEALRFSFELIGTSPAESEEHRWGFATRVGLIASVAPWLDVDVGYQTRLNGAGPQSIALAGATVRW